MAHSSRPPSSSDRRGARNALAVIAVALVVLAAASAATGHGNPGLAPEAAPSAVASPSPTPVAAGDAISPPSPAAAGTSRRCPRRLRVPVSALPPGRGQPGACRSRLR